MGPEERYQFIVDVFSLFPDPEGVFWRVDDGVISLFALCSDFFHWASADLEPIEPEDVPLLRQCRADLRAIEPKADIWLSELFAARKRGMRPMVQMLGAPFYDNVAGWGPGPLQDLFVACGPERPLGSEDWFTP